ncbi:MAG TPA: hypothetical protein VEW46_07890 [Pyrinomonadaceae bacterium]|nr:hypothetical protein [Pyrinomonadaceae bacterium]
MSKRITRFLPPVLAIAVATAGLMFVNSAGSSAQRPAVTPSATKHSAIVATTAEVLRETSEIRELEILRPVKSGAQSRVQIERMLVKKLDEQMKEDEMHAAELGLRKFGLVPEGFEYRPFIIKLLTEQVAGYYDAKAREFYLADWLELEGQKPVMAHELTHALQDQHFSLQRFEKLPEHESDAKLAAHALIEGDATLAMTVYMARNPLVALAFTRSLSAMGASSKLFNESPRALRDTLIFPYAQGMDWATEVYKRGGWKMVSGAYAKLPQSSEQILHPEKYFAYEAPVKVTLPDLTDLLNEHRKQEKAISKQQTAVRKRQKARARGASAKNPTPDTRYPASARQSTPSKWKRVEYDVNGEWSYYLILDQFLNAASISKRAAAGWAGDRYAVYEGPNSQILLTHVSEWDTPNDAEEFFSAYVKRTALRYPGATAFVEEAGNPSIRRWETGEGAVVVELRGSRVIVLEGVPEGLDAAKLLVVTG